MYTFLHKKKINFLSNSSFYNLQDVHLLFFGSKSQTLTQHNNKFFTFCVNFLYNDTLFMHKTYRPSIFSVLLQFKDLISENMKISNFQTNMVTHCLY